MEGVTTAQGAVERVRTVWDIHATYHNPQPLPGHSDAPYVASTYPPEWLARYLLKGYAKVDPVVKRATAAVLPFDWRELDPDPQALDLMVDALDHGLGGMGYTVPLVDRAGRPSLFSINGDRACDAWDTFIRRERANLLELAQFIHGLAVREQYGDEEDVTLAPREREVLMWTARGKTADEIAEIIGISAHTVKSYLKATRAKLNSASIAAAVAECLRRRLID